MGGLQAEQPVLGEVGVGPTLLVRTTTAAISSLSVTKDAPQPHANPAVQAAIDLGRAMTKVSEPAAKRGRERRHDERQAMGSCQFYAQVEAD